MEFDLWHFPIIEDDCYDDWEDDEIPVCPVCQAPYGSCMDVIFQDYGDFVDG
jgi:hypothetical protein